MQDQSRDAVPPLAFDSVLAVVGGGNFEPKTLVDLAQRGAVIVGADGGANAVVAAGLSPDWIVGDLDSLDDPAQFDPARILRIAEQETTDFEKVLYSTSAPVTVCLGMTGKRFDHTLAALDAVTRHGRDRRIILVDEADIALAVSGRFAFAVDVGERVSVHPLEPVRFASSTGLVYPLDGLTLAPGVRTGTSNAATDGPFEIEPADPGLWLLILDRRHLMPLIDALLAR